MRVLVYVEGPSDKLAMEALLAPLLTQKQQQGVSINFFPVKGQDNDKGGDAKNDLLTKIPIKAVDIIRNQSDAIVVAMPDLYPKNKGFKHETFANLKTGIFDKFDETLQRKGIATDPRLRERFKVFCFKHDLEALILAAEEPLKSRLGANSLEITWQLPVGDQNHDLPPRRILENLFKSFGKKYNGKVDAPSILGSATYEDIANRCPQCFQPFVEFLVGIQAENL